MRRPTSPIASMTSSTGMRLSMPASAISAAEIAFTAPMTLRLTHRDLDKARDGVAHKAHQIFERHRHGVADLLVRAAAQRHKRARRHGRRRTDLGLAAAAAPEMLARYAITAPMPEATYSASSSSCCV